MPQAGAERVLGLFEGNQPWPRAGLRRGVEQAEVALRPDMEDPVAALPLHQPDGHVARGDHGVERLGRNAKLQHLPFERAERAAERC